MIDAYEAYNKTKYKKEIMAVQSAIDTNVFNAIESGNYFCYYEFEEHTPTYIRREIEEWLELLGYDFRYGKPVSNPNKMEIRWMHKE